MTISGRCHCGAVTFQAQGEPAQHAICHCGDCRRWAGAPMVGWIAFQEDKVRIAGTTADYRSSELGTRTFCPACGTGLFYRNATILPGIVDIQSATLDHPEDHSPGAQIMVRERLPWAAGIADLPAFATYPGVDA